MTTSAEERRGDIQRMDVFKTIKPYNSRNFVSPPQIFLHAHTINDRSLRRLQYKPALILYMYIGMYRQAASFFNETTTTTWLVRSRAKMMMMTMAIRSFVRQS